MDKKELGDNLRVVELGERTTGSPKELDPAKLLAFAQTYC